MKFRKIDKTGLRDKRPFQFRLGLLAIPRLPSRENGILWRVEPKKIHESLLATKSPAEVKMHL